MLISVSSISEPIKKTSQAGKSYTCIEVEYEANGKTNTKSIVDFVDYYDLLKDAVPGDNFEVETKKDGKFYQWVTVTPQAAGVEPATQRPKAKDVSGENAGNKGNYRPADSYETAAERAHKQELIVRQSSITAALTYYHNKGVPDAEVEDVVEVAQEFRDWVFGVKKEVTPRVE